MGAASGSLAKKWSTIRLAAVKVFKKKNYLEIVYICKSSYLITSTMCTHSMN